MSRTFKVGRFAAFLVSMVGQTYGGEVIVPPEGGQDVIVFSEEGKMRLSQKAGEARSKWVEIDGMPFGRAHQVELIKSSKSAKDLQLILPLKQSFKKGDSVLVSFWVRRPKSSGEPGPATLYVQAGAGKKRYEFRFSPFRQWEQHVRAFAAQTDFEMGKGNVSIHMGAAGPMIEVADLRVVNYGVEVKVSDLPKSRVTYAGREKDAAWRKEALARIEKIRKADLVVQVVDADGKPIPNAEVKVEMKRHAFRFGNTVNAHLLGAEKKDFPYAKKRNGEEYVTTWKEAQQYREVVRKYFNAVTFESEFRPHVWKGMSRGERGRKNYEILMKSAIPWLQKHEIGIRGHYLSWGAMDFNAMEKEYVGNPEGHRKWLWEHMADVLSKTDGVVTEWDTINHIVAWGKHTYEKEYGGMEILAEIMQEARRLAPETTHAINEGKILPDGYKREPYKRVIRFLNEQGQAPDTVGFMAHFGLTSLTPPEELLEVYDDFAKIAPRLQLSEFDVEAGDAEELQADYYRDVMLASFSHPNFDAIVQWGFWEKAHWKPHAALWRKDWSLKPAGEVFVDLVTKQWWTEESGKTDVSGACEVRGFLGNYEVVVSSGGKEARIQTKLERKGQRVRVLLQ
ncbi:endo-1,4-beta-xylanase [Akkermansiaceae bacterium]|nr:endo-1,4-beta-xylanase [Akkermansiaceae bacterium]